jgi:hypothetical protein
MASPKVIELPIQIRSLGQRLTQPTSPILTAPLQVARKKALAFEAQ